MSGLAVLCNSGPVIEIDGKSYQLKGRTIRHLGELEAQILFLRGDVLSHLRYIKTFCDRESAIKSIEGVLKKIRFRWIGCNGEDIHRFYSSLEGRIFSFWQSIRDSGLDLVAARDIYIRKADEDEEWEGKVKFAIEMATGEADISKLYNICGMTRRDSRYTDSYLITKKGLFSTLFKEPFGFTTEQIADMTLGQISLVIGDSTKDSNDISREMSIDKMPNNPGTRRMKATYTKSYHEMAVNIVDGCSLTSGLVK